MTDNYPPYLPGQGHKLKPTSRRQYRRSDEHSPTRTRINDELLSQLTPMSAVDVLHHPTPSLKTCLDASTANEQEFAMRTALASQKIYKWLDELSEWSWPSTGGSAGFELPTAKRRKLSTDDSEERGEERKYLGCLPEDVVMRYEDRIDDITQDLEDLEVDEIKNHVLHNHILPLSRPGTPMSDTRSVISLGAYSHLDDLTAVITAIIIQALPNLSRLTRLLNLWRIRLSVLQGIPSLLSAISEAEVALQSGWNVASTSTSSGRPFMTGESGVTPKALSQKDFEVMKLVLQKKIARPAKGMDAMLDSLEALPDTLPDSWITRMDNLEHNYAAWHAACEAKIRESEWRRIAEAQLARIPSPTPQARGSTITSPEPSASRTKACVPITVEPPDEEQDNGYAQSEDDSSSDTQQTIAAPPARPAKQSSPKTPVKSVGLGVGLDSISQSRAISYPGTFGSHSRQSPLKTPVSLPQSRSSDSDDSSEDVDPVKSNLLPSSLSRHPAARPFGQTPRSLSANITVSSFAQDDPTARGSKEGISQTDGVTIGSSLHESSDSDSSQSSGESEDEPRLPPLINRSRLSSGASYSSTVIHGQTSPFVTSDLPEISASPPLPRDKFGRLGGRADQGPMSRLRTTESDADVEPELARHKNDSITGSPVSPSSSPPAPQSFREDSVDMTDSFASYSNYVRPGSLLNPPSFIEEEDLEDTSSMIESPSKMSDAGADEQLRQQISNILSSIPANIKLAPKRIDLNPPPLDLPVAPRAKKAQRDPVRRSASNLSSRASTRASTPAFLLAPAYGKNPRPRRQGQQETKVYHLSRTTGEAPIKLLIRCVGEQGERVMVRVGGGWADLGEYLKEYAAHHGRRSGNADSSTKIEIRDLPRVAHSTRAATASPPIRPTSALDSSPITPLSVRKTRRSFGAAGLRDDSGTGGGSVLRPALSPKTPAAQQVGKFNDATPPEEFGRSRSSSRLSWAEEDSTLGLAGPTGRKVEMSDESRAWVESVKEKVRLASGERVRPSEDGRFGEMGRVGGTKRLFRKG